MIIGIKSIRRAKFFQLHQLRVDQLVGWAKRSVPTIHPVSKCFDMVGTARKRHAFAHPTAVTWFGVNQHEANVARMERSEIRG